MRRPWIARGITVAVVFVLALMAVGSVAEGDKRGVIGPDILPSRIGLNSSSDAEDFNYYGSSGGVRAFSMASTSCNIGDTTAEWMDEVGGRNPLLAQNLYRLKDGRFEQIGMAWLKNTWCALSEPTCQGLAGQSCSGTGCFTLGTGCADTYWADLNGTQWRLSPRFLVNPQGQGPGGVHQSSYQESTGPAQIRGRLQVADADIQAGGRFFAEIQYVTHDEALDRRYNNASWREVSVTLTSMTGVGTGQESVRQGEPAIMAWAEIDPEVTVVAFEDNPGEGRFHLAYKVSDNGDGTWTYEYALHNLNSDRGAGSFSVPLALDVNITESGFHDVHYHSGDGIGYVNQSSADWPITEGSTTLTWETEAFSRDANANALRWSTLYNFRFKADTPPTTGDVTVGLFKPGTPDSVTVSAAVPSAPPPDCPADIADSDGPGSDGVINLFDLLLLLDNWGTDEPGANLADPPNDVIDLFDLLELIDLWGGCA